jgi:arsenite methyltransferase
MDNNKIKETVKNRYAAIAEEKVQSDCCATTSCCSSSEESDSEMNEEYSGVEGYFAEADLHLGCGLPVQFAGISNGNTVLDLGSGAGNDVFVARAQVGQTGKVIGVDMTEKMLERAEINKQKLGYENVEFRLGEIEDLPIDENSIDVVISNCVLNLVSDKNKAFSEIFRVLKPGGHFCISDIVLNNELPESILKSVELYAECISGALLKHEYLNIISESGFENVEVKIARDTMLSEESLNAYLSPEEANEFRSNKSAVQSITVVGNKP